MMPARRWRGNPCNPCCGEPCECCKPRGDDTPTDANTTFTFTVTGLNRPYRLYVASIGYYGRTRGEVEAGLVTLGYLLASVLEVDILLDLDGDYESTPANHSLCSSYITTDGDSRCGLDGSIEASTPPATPAMTWRNYTVRQGEDGTFTWELYDEGESGLSYVTGWFDLFYDPTNQKRGISFSFFAEYSSLGMQLTFTAEVEESSVTEPYTCDTLSAVNLPLDGGSWVFIMDDQPFPGLPPFELNYSALLISVSSTAP